MKKSIIIVTGVLNSSETISSNQSKSLEIKNNLLEEPAKIITRNDIRNYPIMPKLKSGKHMGKRHKHKNKKFF